MPRDSIVFMGALVPVLVANSIDGGAHITSAGFILGWCLILWAEALYAVFALNVLQTANTATYTAPAHMDSKPRHLAAILETGCDDDLHYRTLRMTGEALNAPNCCVMAAAGITGFAASGPLLAMSGAGLVFALAVHSYARAIRYTIWSFSILIPGYAVLLTFISDMPTITALNSPIAIMPYIALALSGFVSTLAYRFTMIANLRHVAAIAFGLAGLCAALVLGTTQPAITHLTLLSLFLFAPGLSALFGKSRRQCRPRLYGDGDTV